MGLLKGHPHLRKDEPDMELFDSLLVVGLLTVAYLLLFTVARSSACGRATGEAKQSWFEKEVP